MEISRCIGLVLSTVFPLLLLFWAVVRFRQRRKNPSMNAAGLDGGMHRPHAVAASIAWQQHASRVADVPIALDLDAGGGAPPRGGSGQPADREPDREPDQEQEPDTGS